MLARLSFPNKVTIASIVMLNGFLGFMWLVATKLTPTTNVAFMFPEGTSGFALETLFVLAVIYTNVFVFLATRIGVHDNMRFIGDSLKDRGSIFMGSLIVAIVVTLLDSIAVLNTHVFLWITWWGVMGELFLVMLTVASLIFAISIVNAFHRQFDEGWDDAGSAGFFVMIIGAFLMVQLWFVTTGIYVLIR